MASAIEIDAKLLAIFDRAELAELDAALDEDILAREESATLATELREGGSWQYEAEDGTMQGCAEGNWVVVVVPT